MATWKTVTVNPSGGDYASLSAALSGEATDLTAQTGDLVISCENFEDTTPIDTNLQSWVTDATHRIIIEAADSHGGKWSTSAYRLNITTILRAFYDRAGIENIEFRGIQMRFSQGANTFEGFRQDTGAVAGEWVLSKCIFMLDHPDTEAMAETFIHFLDGSPVYKFRNCLFYGMGNATAATAFYFDASTAVVYFDNCTIDGFTYGFKLDGTGVRVRNTRVTNCTGVIDSTGASTSFHADSDYNLTDASAPTNWGANSLDSTDTPTIDYVDDSNATLTSRDYHINSTSDSGYQAGTDLSSDGNNPFTDDIDGDTRG